MNCNNQDDKQQNLNAPQEMSRMADAISSKPGKASVSLKSGDPAEAALNALIGEFSTIKPERFIDLVTAAVDAWEADAVASRAKCNRRGFDWGYHGGKADAYRKIAELLRIYPLIKAGNDAHQTGRG